MPSYSFTAAIFGANPQVYNSRFFKNKKSRTALGHFFTSAGIPNPAISLRLIWVPDWPSRVRVLHPVWWPGSASDRTPARKVNACTGVSLHRYVHFPFAVFFCLAARKFAVLLAVFFGIWELPQYGSPWRCVFVVISRRRLVFPTTTRL